MGQYYHPTLIDAEEHVSWLYTHDYDNGLKLMEHSYIGNSVMNAVCGQIKDHPLRVAWIGDYSDDQNGDAYEAKLPRDAFLRVYRAVYGDHQADCKIQPQPMTFDIESAGWYLVNHTQRQYIALDAYFVRNKWKASWTDGRTGEREEYEMCIHPLSLLTACGNDRGCGDYHQGYPDYNKVGTWAFDWIELTRKKPTKYQEVLYSFSEQRKEEDAA